MTIFHSVHEPDWDAALCAGELFPHIFRALCAGDGATISAATFDESGRFVVEN